MKKQLEIKMKKPSITQLLDLLNKPALIGWANKQGLQGVDIEVSRKKYLNNGTSIHKQIENYITDGVCFSNELHQLSFNNFMEDKEIIDVEKSIETEWFVGRFDASIKYKNKVYLIDYKSNATKIYFENKLQLIAYSMAYPCDAFAVVSVPNFRLIEFDVKEINEYKTIIKSLSDIYKSKLLLNE